MRRRGMPAAQAPGRHAATRQRARVAAAAGVLRPLRAAEGAPVARQEPRLWPGLPSVERIATAVGPLDIHVDLACSPEEYLREAEAMLYAHPELVWQRATQGKPDKMSLGAYGRGKPDNWAQYREVCPRTVDTALKLLRSLPGQDAEVGFGDVLNYGPGCLLGWHQDNMDLSRHTFTAVLTLYAEGDGRFEWRHIAEDGSGLEDVAASVRPGPGDLAIHGLSCNNALAHRMFWSSGRRVALVLFCRSEAMEQLLRVRGLASHVTMSKWWSKAMAAEL